MATAKKTTTKKVATKKEEETVLFTITDAFLKAYPEYAEQGFESGADVELPVDIVEEFEANHAPKEASTGEPEELDEEDASTMKAEATGKFVVRIVEQGAYRLYNPKGVAISPVCREKEAIRRINKQASRFNAIEQARQIKSPKKAPPAPTVQ